MMEQLKNCLTSQISIDKPSLESIVSSFETKTIKKGEFLLKADAICREMAFIEAGYLRINEIADEKKLLFGLVVAGNL